MASNPGQDPQRNRRRSDRASYLGIFASLISAIGTISVALFANMATGSDLPSGASTVALVIIVLATILITVIALLVALFYRNR